MQGVPAHVVASIGEDQSLRVWDLRAGKCVFAKQGHDAAVRWLASVDGGRALLTGAADRSLCRSVCMNTKYSFPNSGNIEAV